MPAPRRTAIDRCGGRTPRAAPPPQLRRRAHSDLYLTCPQDPPVRRHRTAEPVILPACLSLLGRVSDQRRRADALEWPISSGTAMPSSPPRSTRCSPRSVSPRSVMPESLRLGRPVAQYRPDRNRSLQIYLSGAINDRWESRNLPDGRRLLHDPARYDSVSANGDPSAELRQCGSARGGAGQSKQARLPGLPVSNDFPHRGCVR